MADRHHHRAGQLHRAAGVLLHLDDDAAGAVLLYAPGDGSHGATMPAVLLHLDERGGLADDQADEHDGEHDGGTGAAGV